ncbi:MAG: tRNA uridine-5-carboxymethylaminomethyl(34) synthesis GTPase MnmE [Ignavibacteriales bacterium]|nr:tRNA uridine-5-carboxymethylaminomethyl(34) synthesis GTPase MnmE [Ignavibacteriales bacterium]
MSIIHEADTIAAVATPIGEGGLSVIRISGDDAFRIADLGFRGKRSLSEAPSHTAHYGRFVNEKGALIDNVVGLVFRNPHSYTGEDTVELSCHGGQFLVKQILEAVIRYGARAAQAGEFTKRAFLNGRIDLTQAEAVADLIRCRSERAHQSSLVQLNGALSEKMNGLRGQLIESLGLLELELDFAEDGYEFTEKTRVANQLKGLIAQVDELIASYRVGKIYRDGVQVALAGAPNVGKSSLLNAFLKEERAIVTSLPGTTRDIIEESLSLDGILFILSDTAGLRETTDPIEREGVRRAEEKLKSCDILLLMLDRTRPLNPAEGSSAIKLIAEVEARGATCLLVINKVDIAPHPGDIFSSMSEIFSNHPVLEISARTLLGFDRLEAELVRLATGGSTATSESGVMITNARHFSALKKVKRSLELALESTLSRRSSEFIALDLRVGLDAIGEVVGITTTEDILNSIFGKFCIGK